MIPISVIDDIIVVFINTRLFLQRGRQSLKGYPLTVGCSVNILKATSFNQLSMCADTYWWHSCLPFHLITERLNGLNQQWPNEINTTPTQSNTCMFPVEGQLRRPPTKRLPLRYGYRKLSKTPKKMSPADWPLLTDVEVSSWGVPRVYSRDFVTI